MTFHLVLLTCLGYEDCLILNVYTKDPTPSELFPGKFPVIGEWSHVSYSVLVWFHGGGLSTGQGILYGPHFLIETDIIIVTVNYRLGPWGSLSLDTPTISGNQVSGNMDLPSQRRRSTIIISLISISREIENMKSFIWVKIFCEGIEGSSIGTAVD